MPNTAPAPPAPPLTAPSALSRRMHRSPDLQRHAYNTTKQVVLNPKKKE